MIRYTRKRDNPEHRFAVAVAQYLNWSLPVGAWWTTLPTTGSSMFRGAQLKMAGYRKGAPDLVICHEGRAYWVELKAADGVMDGDQIVQHVELRRAGCKVCTVKTIDHLDEWLRQWGIPLRARLTPEPPQIKAARMGGAAHE